MLMPFAANTLGKLTCSGGVWSRSTIKLPNAWERAHGDPSFADEHPCGRLGRSDLLLPFVEQMVLRSFFNIDD
jgi:hypothetical protein